MAELGATEQRVISQIREVIRYVDPNDVAGLDPFGTFAVGYKGNGTLNLFSENIRNIGPSLGPLCRFVGKSGTRYTVEFDSGIMMEQKMRDGKPFGDPTFRELGDVVRTADVVTFGKPLPPITGNDPVTSMLMLATSKGAAGYKDYNVPNPLLVALQKIEAYKRENNI